MFINQFLHSVRPFPEVNINSSKLQYLSSHLNLQLTYDTSDFSKEEFIPPFESKSSNVDAGVDFHHLHTIDVPFKGGPIYTRAITCTVVVLGRVALNEGQRA